MEAVGAQELDELATAVVVAGGRGGVAPTEPGGGGAGTRRVGGGHGHGRQARPQAGPLSSA